MNNAPSANKNNPIGTTPADAWSAAKGYAGVDEQLVESLTGWRRHIHRNPELSYKEFQTTDYIESELNKLGFEVRRFEFGSGLTCDIPAADGSSETDVVALRARRGS